MDSPFGSDGAYASPKHGSKSPKTSARRAKSASTTHHHQPRRRARPRADPTPRNTDPRAQLCLYRQTDRAKHSRSCGRPSRGCLENTRDLNPRRNRPLPFPRRCAAHARHQRQARPPCLPTSRCPCTTAMSSSSSCCWHCTGATSAAPALLRVKCRPIRHRHAASRSAATCPSRLIASATLRAPPAASPRPPPPCSCSAVAPTPLASAYSSLTPSIPSQARP